MSFAPAVSCPLSFSPPFASPWLRELEPPVRRRLTAWCAELHPGAPVELVEWVGADPRQPIHAVVAILPHSRMRNVVLYMKSADVERRHLEEALDISE